MRFLKISQLIILSQVAIFLASCGEYENNTITVYVSADEQIARKVIGDFTSKTGIEVAWVGDTEASKTTGLVTRLRREVSRPVADVFWSSENIGTIHLAQEGVLASCSSTLTDAWPEQFRDQSGYWFAFSPRARVIAYDPKVTKVEEMPLYWWDYSSAAMADPRFGTTGTHLAVMAADADRFESFALALSGTPLLGGNSATVQAVIDGTAKYAMTDSDDVHAAVARARSCRAIVLRVQLVPFQPAVDLLAVAAQQPSDLGDVALAAREGRHECFSRILRTRLFLRLRLHAQHARFDGVRVGVFGEPGKGDVQVEPPEEHQGIASAEQIALVQGADRHVLSVHGDSVLALQVDDSKDRTPSDQAQMLPAHARIGEDQAVPSATPEHDFLLDREGPAAPSGIGGEQYAQPPASLGLRWNDSKRPGHGPILEEGAALPSIGGLASCDAAPPEEQVLVEALGQFAGLGVAEEHGIAEAQGVRHVAQRGLHLAGSLHREVVEP